MSTTSLENHIRRALTRQQYALMPHLVLGFPDWATNEQQVAAMVAGGAELIELQIPFSEPVADGLAIANANMRSLERGTTVESCFRFAAKMAELYPAVAFLWMTYGNIPYQMGLEKFVQKTAEAGVQGIILPDLPPEEAGSYVACCRTKAIAPIFIFTPFQSPSRLQKVAELSGGMVYCVARKGVTGLKTDFSTALQSRLEEYRHYTKLPLALGFGVSDPKDIQGLAGKLEVVVIGSKLLEIQQNQGTLALTPFLKSFQRALVRP